MNKYIKYGKVNREFFYNSQDLKFLYNDNNRQRYCNWSRMNMNDCSWVNRRLFIERNIYKF